MVEMSGFEKFFVNRLNQYGNRRAFTMIRQHLTLPEGASCLELGAGRGFLSYLINERYSPGRLFVTDYDPAQVQEAKAYLQSKHGTIPSNVELRVADTLDLPFEDESFDAIFAMLVLHHTERREWHFKNIPKALDEITRVLKRDGHFVYAELFNKIKIRSHLDKNGFEEVLAKRYYMMFDFCIYRKIAQNPY